MNNFFFNYRGQSYIYCSSFYPSIYKTFLNFNIDSCRCDWLCGDIAEAADNDKISLISVNHITKHIRSYNHLFLWSRWRRCTLTRTINCRVHIFRVHTLQKTSLESNMSKASPKISPYVSKPEVLQLCKPFLSCDRKSCSV